MDAKATRTRKRRLHEDMPFWAATPHISAPCIPQSSARSWDVIVVGSGISGALMAEALTRRKQRVLILDRREPVRGSSLASTAMIQHEIDVPLHQLARQIGDAQAARAWQRSVRAVRDLLRLADRLGIDCDMQAKQALYLCGDRMGNRAMQAELEARQAAGIAGEYLAQTELASQFGIDRTGAILSQASASANPAQLTAGLLGVAVQRGAEIASPVEITDLAELQGGVALATRAGGVLTAGQAVFSTGYEFLPLMQSPSHRITSTWALSSHPGTARPGWLDDMLVWEAADPYLYFRTARDGRIIAGGEDSDAPDAYRDPARMRASARCIAAKLRKLCGIEIGPPAYIWAAPFGNTSDGLPIIDRVPDMRRVHAVMGFGGNGITFSMIAAQIVAARLAGRRDPDEELFAFR
ncbi:NAD(P)/FAD-dependent oxidoreductase [Paracoccus laeviglucosivorans]|uniref:Glycine/D-amino acid oxidase n=1 Tax=Paracoccus laeviglucosivorans TaxID=1197861 RepID=A0A521ENU6_9RHOB|nr:FAD-dependent oxidoreductase [Paracoccus laeviglucosivorans]SMO85607.1 Glycine/D-amino acid oxidase [Paracoccus laeviglucosivorans]